MTEMDEMDEMAEMDVMDVIAKTIELNIIEHFDFILQYLELSKKIDINSISFTYVYLYYKFRNCISELYPNQFIENYKIPSVLTLNFDEESVNDIITDDFIDDLSPEIKNLRVFVKEYIGNLSMNCMKPIEPMEPMEPIEPIEPMEPIEPIFKCPICLEGLISDESSCETPWLFSNIS